MDGNRLTDERLRTWLDGNQPNRERMCAQLLSLLGNYEQITPRRPRGGPDGGRDLQAVFIPNQKEVFGAVGFRNSPSDSREDKQWIINKFKSNFKAAIKAKPDLFGFIFFTNVDLTPGEVQKLMDEVTSKGVSHCQIFSREKLRLTLDSTQGIGIRATFLKIHLSIEELTAFVSYLGQRHAEELLKLEQRQAELVLEQQELRQATFSLQQTMSNVAVRLDSITQQIVSTFTGGDSFCYIVFSATSNGATGNMTVIHKGQYPLFDVVCREEDLIRYREHSEQGIPPLLHNSYCTRHIQIGNLPPGMVKTINVFPRLHEGGVLKLNLFFTGRNGEWIQLLRLQRDPSGIWHMSTKVTRLFEQILLFEQIDESYPWNPHQNEDEEWTRL